MATRRVLIAGGAAVIVALVIGGVMWKRSSGSAEETRATDRAPVATAPRTTSTASSTPSASTSSAPAAPDGQPAPGLIPHDQPPPLPPPGYKPAPRAPANPLTPTEELGKKQEAVRLLDRNITRLEGELAAAEKAGDVETAKSLAIRIKRMREARAKQAAELEQK